MSTLGFQWPEKVIEFYFNLPDLRQSQNFMKMPEVMDKSLNLSYS